MYDVFFYFFFKFSLVFSWIYIQHELIVWWCLCILCLSISLSRLNSKRKISFHLSFCYDWHQMGWSGLLLILNISFMLLFARFHSGASVRTLSRFLWSKIWNSVFTIQIVYMCLCVCLFFNSFIRCLKCAQYHILHCTCRSFHICMANFLRVSFITHLNKKFFSPFSEDVNFYKIRKGNSLNQNVRTSTWIKHKIQTKILRICDR